MIDFQSVIVPLSAALGLSLVVERVLEFLKNILLSRIKSQEGRQIPPLEQAKAKIDNLENTRRLDLASQQLEEEAEKLKPQQLRAKLDKEKNPQKRADLQRQLVELEAAGGWDEQVPRSLVLVTPASDPDEGQTLRVLMVQMIGFAIGIILARVSNVSLFNSFLADAYQIPLWTDYLLTGLLIGGGSGPMHILVRFITQRKVPAGDSDSAEENEELPVTTLPAGSKPGTPAVILPAPVLPTAGGLDISYRGGVDRERLENVHRRPADPDTIIYHHTTMHRDSTFQDVVRVIKSRTDKKGNHWITGYNCVVTAAGSIHPFCRWDRYGNHAAGYNRRSLGLAFNGNFETNPRVPASNPDGRFGPPVPSEDQLKAGARVTALWAFLYGIPLDFEKNIIPHRQISSKACPGSGFPEEDYKKWVEFYFTQWQKSEAVQEQLAAFKLKPYLFA